MNIQLLFHKPGHKTSRALTLAFILLVGTAFYFMYKPEPFDDISEEHPRYTSELLQAWANGEMIVLLRHLERCDKYDVPCLTDKEGITARAKPVGEELHDDFRQQGLENVRIYNSPELRTAETEALVFNDIGEPRLSG